MVFHSHSYLYELVNTSENDDINFVQLVIEIPQETQEELSTGVNTFLHTSMTYTETIIGLQDFTVHRQVQGSSF